MALGYRLQARPSRGSRRRVDRGDRGVGSLWHARRLVPEEIDKLRQGGDGHIVVWGGVSLWRSLVALDLIDEWHLSMCRYVAGEGTLLFDDVPKSYRLDLVSSTAAEASLPAVTHMAI
jgi:dihydrofolate reductase